jgi:hypothetical protein
VVLFAKPGQVAGLVLQVWSLAELLAVMHFTGSTDASLGLAINAERIGPKVLLGEPQPRVVVTALAPCATSGVVLAIGSTLATTTTTIARFTALTFAAAAECRTRNWRGCGH